MVRSSAYGYRTKSVIEINLIEKKISLLREAIGKAGSISRLAKELGMLHSTLSSYLNGVNKMPSLVYEQILKYLEAGGYEV